MFTIIVMTALMQPPNIHLDWGGDIIPDVVETPAEDTGPKFPKTCVLEFTAKWCGPCNSDQNKDLIKWLEKSKWKVVPIDWDTHTEFCRSMGITKIPTYIVLVKGEEKARYTGTSWRELLPDLKRAVQ